MNDTTVVQENEENKFSWSGFIVGIISKNTRIAVFTFFGFFMPFTVRRKCK